MNKSLGQRNILIATIGSLGDLHPCLALGRELSRRGHRVAIATTPYYRIKVEDAGLSFLSMRPDWDPTDAKLISSCENLRRGLEVLYRQMLLPNLEDTYHDLIRAAETADLLIAGELVYAAPLAAEKLGLPWVSVILSPFSFFSCIDPSFTVNLPILFHLRRCGPVVYKAALSVGKLATRHWSNPVRQFRHDEKLRTECDPVFQDKFSPYLVLALFSQWFAPKRSDWPEQTLQPGFVSQVDPDLDAHSRLHEFLSAGAPPLVFTQGSTAVHNPRDFYDISAEVARRLHLRALLIGTNSTRDEGCADVLAMPYVPYSHVFPRASVIIHQGGSGTTGEALRAGRPMLIVPYGWDQPDNAYRIERLGAGLHLPRNKYTVETAAAAIRLLLDNPRFAVASAELALRIQGENAIGSACDAIDSLLLRASRASPGVSYPGPKHDLAPVTSDKPFISVIIPAFNEERCLPATLHAVANSMRLLRSQDRLTTELIVVDNNSADATAKLAESLGARVVTESQHNIARVRNRGAASAQGKVLVFLDADTCIPEDLLRRIHQALAAPGCLGGAVDTEYRPNKRSVRLYLDLWRILGRAAGLAQGATQFCLRDTFTALGGYDESLFMGEDVDFYARMRRYARNAGGTVRFINEVRVIPSCRRFDQWALWRTLIWTNPLVIAPLRRARSKWRAWYDAPLR